MSATPVSQRPDMNGTGARAEALARLSDRDRNIILLYRRGGAEALLVEGYVRNLSEAEALFADVKRRASAQRVPAALDPSLVEANLDHDDPAEVDEDAEHEDFPADDWPHTEGTVRRQIVEPEDKDVAARVKRQRLGRRDYSRLLAAVDEGDDDLPSDVPGEETEASSDPRRSPILEWLERHKTGSAPQIAEHLGRKTANVSTRLRQLEQGGFVRRTGQTLPGGRGGPQIEWELCHDTKPPTGPEDVLTSPLTPPPEDDLRLRYFEHLLTLATADAPEHIFERLERITGTAA